MRTAAIAHRSQHRKQTDIPYFAHPAAVALLLARAGVTDEATLAAAVLHDVLEDTELTEQVLRREFPAEVVDIVCAASERKLDEQGNKRPWVDRKRDHVRDIAGASPPARAVVLADKLHNLQSIAFDLAAGEPVWDRFNAPRERILQYHAEMIDAAAGENSELAALQAAASEVLQQLLNDPESETDQDER